jgi:hypothetical protein
MKQLAATAALLKNYSKNIFQKIETWFPAQMLFVGNFFLGRFFFHEENT